MVSYLIDVYEPYHQTTGYTENVYQDKLYSGLKKKSLKDLSDADCFLFSMELNWK